jgi:dephospho-CoA kinase
MTLPNIAILGRLRSGKDTVGDYLASKYGYTQFAFADEMKADFHRRYPEIPRDPKPRAGYQFHGQFMREHYGENVWVDACFDNIAYSRNCPVSGTDGPVVITDVRQESEYEALAARSYVIIRVTAPDGLRIERAVNSGDTFAYADLAHGTETALDEYAADYTVTNNGSLAELYAAVDEIIAELTIREAA